MSTHPIAFELHIENDVILLMDFAPLQICWEQNLFFAAPSSIKSRLETQSSRGNSVPLIWAKLLRTPTLRELLGVRSTGASYARYPTI
jgi:hypothetical protein